MAIKGRKKGGTHARYCLGEKCQCKVKWGLSILFLVLIFFFSQSFLSLALSTFTTARALILFPLVSPLLLVLPPSFQNSDWHSQGRAINQSINTGQT